MRILDIHKRFLAKNSQVSVKPFPSYQSWHSSCYLTICFRTSNPEDIYFGYGTISSTTQTTQQHKFGNWRVLKEVKVITSILNQNWLLCYRLLGNLFIIYIKNFYYNCDYWFSHSYNRIIYLFINFAIAILNLYFLSFWFQYQYFLRYL